MDPEDLKFPKRKGKFFFDLVRRILPDEPRPTRILRGPFRGASIVMNPRMSMRKIFGLYEHELNAWLEQALRRVTCVLDVGANDGYFTYGCAAAFERLGTQGTIVAIEKQEQHIVKLKRTFAERGGDKVKFELVRAFAGREAGPGFVTLNSVGEADRRTDTLVKIDVEGAEVDVVEGGRDWIQPSNCFLIEVHREPFLEQLQRIFAEQNHPLTRIDQQGLPLLGRDRRESQNWWLVSDLSAKR